MDRAVCSCRRQFRIACGYHNTRCLLQVSGEIHASSESDLLLVCDLKCPSCQKVVGHQVLTGPDELHLKWKLFDDLYQVREETIGEMLTAEMLPLIKRYEAAIGRINKLEGMLIDIDRHLQDIYKHIRRTSKPQ